MSKIIVLVSLALGAGIILLASHTHLMATADDIAVVKERHEAWLLSLPGVIGVGIGDCDGRPCIIVYAVEHTPELAQQIPRQLEGFAVTLEVSGPIDILPAASAPNLPNVGHGESTARAKHTMGKLA